MPHLPAGTDPLAALNVVEVASTYPGAFTGRLLAEAGLPVLRIETGPPGALDSLPPHAANGHSVAWLGANAKKSVIRIDPERGSGLLQRLVAASDVFLSDEARWNELQARGVSCRIQPHDGLVAEGSDMASVDVLAQARGGAITATGRLTGPPVSIGFPVGDVAPGVYGTIAVLNGLLDGRQQVVTVRAFDATISLLSYFCTCYKVDGEDIGFIGSGHPYIVPYGAFPASDGWVIVAAFTQVFWRKLCTMLGREDLAQTPRFKNFSLRRDNRVELNGLIADIFRTGTVAHWSERLREADVPHAPVYTMHQALHQPVIGARGVVQQVQGLSLINTPMIDLCRRAAGLPERPEVTLDWRARLLALGLAAGEIETLVADGVLRPVDCTAAA